MGRYRSRSRSRSYSPARHKHYDEPRDHRRERRSSPAPSGLLVRNISLSARTEDLREPFERFGPIKDVYIPKNYYTGEPRGFGFVKFRHSEDAAQAKAQLNHTVIGGREIRIVYAEENRKTPQEMRKLTRTSDRGSRRRRSLSRSPRRRHGSYSPSPSPARRDSRDRDRGARKGKYGSRSVSPREERSYRSHEKSPRQSGSFSDSPSPRKEKHDRPSPGGDRGHRVHDVDGRSQSPRRMSRSPSRSRSRSYSPR
ncbi:OLC1v1020279C1 [Oldenlandia corymbosa var. corymbosa]|uniref:OLC1v1020279C1 n=1 Tax=Oldenlandia corymbosa var. corymbosa TaxID=529605 RepID=A0AAV1EGJ1_OLDCO|nr:OLC1v1020279C1 [Oldenlandia corymbosa var. corymbosa]